MNMRLCSDTQNAVLEFVDERLFSMDAPGLDTPNLAPEHREYENLFGGFEDWINKAIRNAYHAAEDQTEAERQENFRKTEIMRVAELLKNHTLL